MGPASIFPCRGTVDMSQTLSQRSWEWIKEQPDFHSNELAKEMEVSLYQAQMVIDHLKQLGAVTTVNRKQTRSFTQRLHVQSHIYQGRTQLALSQVRSAKKFGKP